MTIPTMTEIAEAAARDGLDPADIEIAFATHDLEVKRAAWKRDACAVEMAAASIVANGMLKMPKQTSDHAAFGYAMADEMERTR